MHFVASLSVARSGSFGVSLIETERIIAYCRMHASAHAHQTNNYIIEQSELKMAARFTHAHTHFLSFSLSFRAAVSCRTLWLFYFLLII